MHVTAVEIRDFRNYEKAEVNLDSRLTVIAGPNGAGKTNLLEALFFGVTGRSPRTSADSELVRHGAGVGRVKVTFEAADGAHVIETGFEPGREKVVRVNGDRRDSHAAIGERPLMSVFLPERLDLVKGAPARRRGHLDQFVAGMWPARAATRSAYGRALAQRNALLARIRAGRDSRSLDSWDRELAGLAIDLMSDRRAATALLERPCADRAQMLGLPGEFRVAYRSRSDATSIEQFTAELVERRDRDIERGFGVHGPHRDDLQLQLSGRSLRSYGSQGQQRLSLLALLIAERDVLLEERGTSPLLLLDDVMSELDADRRQSLVDLLRRDGQSLITTTEPGHVPGAGDSGTVLLAVTDGRLAETLQS